jgi:hypothetical protein
MYLLGSTIRYILFLWLFVLFGSICGDNRLEFKSEIANFKFQMGLECKMSRQSMEDCTSFLVGHGSCNITMGHSCKFHFEANEEMKAIESPVIVDGELTALFMENVTQTHKKVSGMIQFYKPEWNLYQLEGAAEKPIRIYLKRVEWGKRIRKLDYQWVEISIFGSYSPSFHTVTRRTNKQEL